MLQREGQETLGNLALNNEQRLMHALWMEGKSGATRKNKPLLEGNQNERV